MTTIELPRSAATKKTAHPKALLVSEQGQRVTLPYGPVDVDHAEIGMDFVQLERSGRSPLLEKKGRRLPTMTFTAVIARTGLESVEDILGDLRELADAGDRVTMSFGPSEGGWWRLTGLSFSSVQRQAGTNHITHANATLTFQRADDGAAPKVGPLSGGAVDVGKKTAAVQSGTSVVIKKGETLSQIAARVYGTPSRWPEIAKANGIKDPRKVPAGMKLRIP
jgi:LysM repeat protein